jgi:hypothetical protein
MTDYLKQTLKTDLALSFAQSFASDNDDNYFLFLGKTFPWNDEQNPPKAQDTLSEELSAWRNMIALAKVNKSNVCVGVARYNWEYNKVFAQFDDFVDLYEEGNEKQFYVITDDLNVYKCISNNYNSLSLYKPTTVSSEEQITQDGYVWKFMFKVREELYEFLTDDFIPIEKLESILYNDERSLQNNVKLSSVPSSIENILVTQYGGSYPLAVIDDPSSTDQKHRIMEVVNSSTFVLSSVFDVDQTNGIYEDYYELYIAQGPGAGSKATITSYTVIDGEITVVLDKQLNGVTTNSIYRIYPKISIIGDGEGAVAIPVMNSDKMIVSIDVLNSGKNYRYATVKVYRKNETYSSVTLARAILSPIFGHGYDAIRELGANYVLIHVPLRNSEKITQANALNILNNDYRQVGLLKNAYKNNTQNLEPITTEDNLKTYLQIENINSYSVIYLEAIQDILANTQTNIAVGDIIKQGSEQNAYQARGIVKSVVTTKGTLFEYKITVQNTNGRFLPSSSSTYPLIKNDDTVLGGNITGVDVSNIYDENTFTANKNIIGTISNSTAKVVRWECDPYGLSGKLFIDNVKGSFIDSYYTKTLGGDIVIVKGENIVSYDSIISTPQISDLDQDGDIDGNDFDILLDSWSGPQLSGINASTSGIIADIGTLESVNKVFYKVSTTLNLVPSTGNLTSGMFEPDDIIINTNGIQGRVISFTLNSPTSGTLEVNGLTGSFAANQVLSILDSTEITTNARISTIIQPEVLPYYGDMIYIQNVVPVTAANDSEEHIKVLIKF